MHSVKVLATWVALGLFAWTLTALRARWRASRCDVAVRDRSRNACATRSTIVVDLPLPEAREVVRGAFQSVGARLGSRPRREQICAINRRHPLSSGEVLTAWFRTTSTTETAIALESSPIVGSEYIDFGRNRSNLAKVCEQVTERAEDQSGA